MPCSRSAEAPCGRRRLAASLAALGLLLASPHAQASEFTVQQAHTRLVEDVYLLDADMRLELSDEALEALHNGVPLTVILDLEILRARWLVWDEQVARYQTRYQLEFHALSDRYVLKDLDTGESRSFHTLSEATAQLGHIDDLPAFGSDLVEPGAKYTVRLRARLDIEALPSPLRPLAYLSSLWRLGSDWYAWQLEP